MPSSLSWANFQAISARGGRRRRSSQPARWRRCRPRRAWQCPAGWRQCGTGCRPCRSSSRLSQRLGGGQAGAFAIAADVASSVGMPRLHIQAPNAAKGPRRDVPGHAVVAEVGQRVAQRRQLPVEHRDDPRLGRMEHQVVEPVVAMHDGCTGLIARVWPECARAATPSACPSRQSAG
jgi:hypothetical protein